MFIRFVKSFSVVFLKTMSTHTSLDQTAPAWADRTITKAMTISRQGWRFLFVLLFLGVSACNSKAQSPPYAGTIFITPGLITATDCSTLLTVTPAGTGSRVVFDRRVNNWITINAYLFDVLWDDSLRSQAVVNPEFTPAEAATQAQKYAWMLGQLPYCLRTDIAEIWIHKGNNDWGGGNQSVLIHTDRAAFYENLGIAEETLMHEATHTSLDAQHALSTGWINAQTLDGNFISTYAQQFPQREDLAETFVPWLAVRHFSGRITAAQLQTITQTIPNRLAYLDAQAFNLNPIPCAASSVDRSPSLPAVKVYPNPFSDVVYFEGPFEAYAQAILYNGLGQQLQQFTLSDNRLDLSAYPNGMYFLLLKNRAGVWRTSLFKQAP